MTELLTAPHPRFPSVLVLTLNREERRNALSPSLLQALIHALESAHTDPTIRAICLTGAGDRSFSSGADLSSSFSSPDLDPLAASRLFAHLLQVLQTLSKPTLARINGSALGGGFGLMLACDLVVAAEDAKVGTPEVLIGLFPMMIAPLVLRHFPRKRAMQMILTGEQISASEAHSFHAINAVVPRSDLDAATDRWLENLLRGAPLAQERGKRALQDTASLPYGEAVAHLAEHLAFLLQTDDAAEGISARIEKRPPLWSGK